MAVRVVVLPGPVVDLTARVTALDLDRRVPDREPVAKPLLEVAHNVLGLSERAIVDNHMDAERSLL